VKVNFAVGEKSVLLQGKSLAKPSAVPIVGTVRLKSFNSNGRFVFEVAPPKNGHSAR